MNLDIRSKLGGYECVFNIGEQEYLASLIEKWIPYDENEEVESECMIFKSKDRQFTFADADGVYSCHSMPFSEEGLRQCIEEFIASQQ